MRFDKLTAGGTFLFFAAKDGGAAKNKNVLGAGAGATGVRVIFFQWLEIAPVKSSNVWKISRRLLGMKTDSLARRFRRIHETTDRVEDDLEVLVVFAFKIVHFAGEAFDG